MTPTVKARLRSAGTLAVLAVLLLGGVAWAWATVTEPFPKDAETPVCVATPVAPGDRVSPEEVVVSVLNAGEREGLAGTTMDDLTENGFVQGGSKNAPRDVDVAYAQVWTDDPKSPAVRLARTFLGEGAEVVERDASGPGVTIVVGDEFPGVVAGRESMGTKKETQICSPPGESGQGA